MRAFSLILSFLLVLLALPSVSCSQSMPDGWENWEAECAAGDAESCHNFAERHRMGIGMPVNLPKAVGLYQTACSGGVWQACETGGILLWNGQNGVTENVPQAMLMLNTGCQSGSARACSVLSSIFGKGQKGIKADAKMQQALEYVACQNGSAIDCGIAAMDQTNTAQDTMMLLARGCDLGDVFSCLEGGRRLERGVESIPANPVQAQRFYARGCTLGTPVNERDACIYALRLSDPQAAQPATRTEAARQCDTGVLSACNWMAEVTYAAKDYVALEDWLARACALKDDYACKMQKEFSAYNAQYDKWQNQERAIAEREAQRNADIEALLNAGDYNGAMNRAVYDYGSPELASRVLSAAAGKGRLDDFENFTFDILHNPGWSYRLTPSARTIAEGQYVKRDLNGPRQMEVVTNTRDLPRSSGGYSSQGFYMFDFGLAPSATNAERTAYHRKEQKMCSDLSWC